MILKGSQRGGPRQLAAHLLNNKDNDHVTLLDVRGFVSSDLRGAMTEATAIAKTTRCIQPIFSLSLNPPKDASVTVADFVATADRAETALGLQGQPRAIVIHEKLGRKHAHVVWSRIDPNSMTAINLPHFKYRLRDLSKNLYLENDWPLPEGHRTNGWKNPLNFTLAEWQQAKRLDLDPREIKQIFQDAWHRSDNLASFKNALEECGIYLARGDRRGIVATDVNGEIYSVSRWSGVPTKALRQKFGSGESLTGIEEVQADIRKRMSDTLRSHIVNDRKLKEAELSPLKTELLTLVLAQRLERAELNSKQVRRSIIEATESAGRFRRGIGGVWDFLSGRQSQIRRENEQTAHQRYLRDAVQREHFFKAQMKERAPLQAAITLTQARHRQERALLARMIGTQLHKLRHAHRHIFNSEATRGRRQPSAHQ